MKTECSGAGIFPGICSFFDISLAIYQNEMHAINLVFKSLGGFLAI